MLTPKARGALSEALFEAMRVRPGDLAAALAGARAESVEDEQIALWALYELHYRGFDDLDGDLEWEPALLALRQALERQFEARLRERYVGPELDGAFADNFFSFVEDHDGPSLADHVRRARRPRPGARAAPAPLDLPPQGGRPHRLGGAAAPTARQGGAGRAPVRRVRRRRPQPAARPPLRARAGGGRAALGVRRLRRRRPVEILEQNNAMSLFGLHRRLRGAAVGHLAAFETTSSLPSRRLAQGLDRLGLRRPMVDYYDEHVAADAVARAARRARHLRRPRRRGRARADRRRVLRRVHLPGPRGPVRARRCWRTWGA